MRGVLGCFSERIKVINQKYLAMMYTEPYLPYINNVIVKEIGVSMPISCFEAAKKVCTEANWKVSNFRLQRILYISHMIFLGRHEKPLIRENFCASVYGPIIPELYDKLCMFGAKPIPKYFHRVKLIEGTLEAKLLEEAVSSLELVKDAGLLGYVKGKKGAWALFYDYNFEDKIIPDKAIEEEYQRRFNDPFLNPASDDGGNLSV